MIRFVHPSRYAGRDYTWDQFRSAVRSVDRDSLLIEAAAASAVFASGEDQSDWKRFGVTPWTVADVARTALAWGGPARTRATRPTLFRLCNMNAQLIDEDRAPSISRVDGVDGSNAEESPEAVDVERERLGRVLARIYFEQFPGQRSIGA